MNNNQSSLILHKKVIDRQANITIGLLSNSSINQPNKMGFSRNHDSVPLNNMGSKRILGPVQDHKRKCFEKLVVIDDTALIETTGSITGFKNRYAKHRVGVGSSKKEIDGKLKRNKGVKKLQERCSMKCLNEKKLIGTTEKKVPQVKGQKGYPKMPSKVKFGYQMKGIKIFGEIMQKIDADVNVSDEIKQDLATKLVETDVNLKGSVGTEKELTTKLVETDVNLKASVGIEEKLTTKLAETDVNMKVSVGNEKELTTKLLETEADTVKSNPIIAVNAKKIEAEGRTVHENTSVGSTKVAYSREELEVLRFVDEEGQKGKWAEVYSGFAPSVVREYTGLVVDANNRPTQRYTRVVNCRSTRGANAILNVPPVLPLCSPSNYV